MAHWVEPGLVTGAFKDGYCPASEPFLLQLFFDGDEGSGPQRRGKLIRRRPQGAIFLADPNFLLG